MSSPATWLLQTCEALVTCTEPPGRLLALRDGIAALAMPDRSLVMLFTTDFGPPDVLERELADAVTRNPGVHLKLVVLGGDAAHREAVRSARPRLDFRRAVQTFHVANDGSLWVGPATRRDSPVGRALARAAAGDAGVPDRAMLAARIAPTREPSPEDAAALGETRAFIERMRGSRLLATPILLAVLVAVYALQWWWGGGTTPALLVRMGANTPASLHGEPQRLLSSAFLHGGVLHLAVNAWVVWILGGFIERLLGPARLLVLWVLAGAAGSLASVLVGGAELSVGASGALWGTLAAVGVLALRPRGVLPDSVVPAIRRTAAINLAIAASVSFLPRVDLWAHLGGGVAGAVALLAMRPGLTARESDTGERPAASTLLRTFAAGLVVTAFVSLALSWVHGRPWALREVPTLRAHALPAGIELSLPVGIGEPRRLSDGNATVLVFGDLRRDPLVAIVSVTPHDLAPHEITEQAADAAHALPAPEGAVLVEPWRPVVGTPYPTFEARWTADEVIGRGAWQLRDLVVVELEVWWPTDAPSASATTASEILDSFVRP